MKTKTLLCTLFTLTLACKCQATQHQAKGSYNNWYYKHGDKYSGWKYIVIHHSASASGSVETFHRYHNKMGYGGIAYHFVIGNGKGMDDGEVAETFRWQRQMSGTHVSVNSWDHNIFGIGIVLVGNYEKGRPKRKQLIALRKLISRLQKKYSIPNKNVITHKTVHFDHDTNRTEQTLCPGKHLEAWVRDHYQRRTRNGNG